MTTPWEAGCEVRLSIFLMSNNLKYFFIIMKQQYDSQLRLLKVMWEKT